MARVPGPCCTSRSDPPAGGTRFQNAETHQLVSEFRPTTIHNRKSCYRGDPEKNSADPIIFYHLLKTAYAAQKEEEEHRKKVTTEVWCVGTLRGWSGANEEETVSGIVAK